MSQGPQNNPGSKRYCKIKASPNLQIKSEDLPVTIQLCEDRNLHPAKSCWFTGAEVKISGTDTLAQNQPTNITNTTFDLRKPEDNPKNKKYDVWMKVGHKPNACCYVFEACSDSPPQLCFIDTSVGPTRSFTIEVL